MADEFDLHYRIVLLLHVSACVFAGRKSTLCVTGTAFGRSSRARSTSATVVMRAGNCMWQYGHSIIMTFRRTRTPFFAAY
ncbi:hypothetical protein [Streptomyces sp. NPDC056785]|uniref:hypothetical protein n=1 Tax=Streptomyces sp. NPDC056785 TaxID=3345944 RepID=UPI0036B0708B